MVAEHLAIVARRDLPSDDFHPNLIIVGPTQTWKTWALQAVCSILGLDPGKHIVLCPAESGRSLFIRKDARGEIVSKRDLL